MVKKEKKRRGDFRANRTMGVMHDAAMAGDLERLRVSLGAGYTYAPWGVLLGFVF